MKKLSCAFLMIFTIFLLYEGVKGQVCSPAACDQNDRCEKCPGCAYLDYYCSGDACRISYIDPDAQKTYCEVCGLVWSGEGEQKNCCGDDRNEYWVPYCTNPSSYKCCNNPSDRVDSNGNCVRSCGIGIKVNITEVKEEPIGLAISVLPESIDIEPGGKTEFRVYIKTDWNSSIHNVSISFCKEYEFQVEPLYIPEMKPGEIRYFEVKMYAPENSTLGKKELEIYVDADEFINKRQKGVTLTVGKVDYITYFIYAGLIIAIIALFLARKIMAYRESR
ncbi:MAG: hypothetical protein QXN71_03730 [Candidatus Aenigmatarchaeota archaeon]